MTLLPVIFVAGIIALLGLTMSGGVSLAYTNDIPGGNIADPVIRAVDIAQPAVVRILTQVDGRLTVQFSSGNVTFPQGGNNGYPLVLSGTGTFISAHGDILTADHVVSPPRADLDQFLQQTAAQDVANYMNVTLHANPQVTPDQVTQELASGQLNSTSQYDTPLSRVYLSTAFTGPLSATTFQSIPANVFANVDRIEAQSSVNQKDVAIIHVSNMDNMPMVQLGDSSGVQAQDQLTIIGFPGNGDVSVLPTNLLTSSVNSVTVSSIKTTDTGAPLIQVGGNVEHGDSGGPALDSGGNVVGIVSFGSNQPGNTSFLQASISARALVQQLGLNTTPGSFQKLWSQAFNDYGSTTAGHWHKAAQEFQQLAANFPQFKGVTPFLQYAQQQAKAEKVAVTPVVTPVAASSSPSLASNWPILAAGVVLVLVILLFGVVVVRRRGAKPALTAGDQKYRPPVSAATAYPFTPTANPGVNQASSMPSPPQANRPQPQNGLTAFGAPSAPPAPYWPAPSQPAAPLSQPPASASPGISNVAGERTDILVPWPCGHMNRRVAHFCSVCGEPAPKQPPVRRYEQ
ncbi:MAG TPA: trypsin-like peptidase domain-containing protein [Ktedonobacteraceae bacterium]|nr:trypsin-like peptidase domain-containing protein [Ktedonobacteraceae bacterium]